MLVRAVLEAIWKWCAGADPEYLPDEDDDWSPPRTPPPPPPPPKSRTLPTRRNPKRGAEGAGTPIGTYQMDMISQWIAATPNAAYTLTPDGKTLTVHLNGSVDSQQLTFHGDGFGIHRVLLRDLLEAFPREIPSFVDLASHKASLYWRLAYCCGGSIARMDAFLEELRNRHCQ